MSCSPFQKTFSRPLIVLIGATQIAPAFNDETVFPPGLTGLAQFTYLVVIGASQVEFTLNSLSGDTLFFSDTSLSIGTSFKSSTDFLAQVTQTSQNTVPISMTVNGATPVPLQSVSQNSINKIFSFELNIFGTPKTFVPFLVKFKLSCIIPSPIIITGNSAVGFPGFVGGLNASGANNIGYMVTTNSDLFGGFPESADNNLVTIIPGKYKFSFESQPFTGSMVICTSEGPSFVVINAAPNINIEKVYTFNNHFQITMFSDNAVVDANFTLTITPS